jgi:hypothetical protein
MYKAEGGLCAVLPYCVLHFDLQNHSLYIIPNFFEKSKSICEISAIFFVKFKF